MNGKVAIIVSSTIAVVAAYTFCLPRELFTDPVCAVLESREGQLLGARIASDGQWRFPSSDNVPDKFAACITAYEDKHFHLHPGIDPTAVARAIVHNIRGGGRREGASTITMQVIRLSRGVTRRSFTEKCIEAILATRLELRCSKDEILRLYADHAPFGGNVVGINAAAWRYWGRSADELSWAESATLAVLPNSPALIHPGRSRDKLLEKRNFLLGKLLSDGAIDSVEYTLALDEPLPDKPRALPDHARHYLETLRKEKGDRLFPSSINTRLQTKAEEILKTYAGRYIGNGVGNIAALILDVDSGEPVVYCGNTTADEELTGKNNGSEVDVICAGRSSGSTLKPLLYAGMLDDGLILPTMLIADTPFHYKDFSPSNFNHSFDGAVTAESVIRRSLNVPSVRMLHQYGTARFLDLLKKCGFTTINRSADDYGLSLILGGAEISLKELAGTYRKMALTLKHKDCGLPLSEGAVWCTFEALKGVTRPEEEGSWESFSSSREIAWKTGTSYGNRDAWCVGVTPEYVIAVWAGNCSGEGRPMLTGTGYAAPVMFDLLGLLPAGVWFNCPWNSLREVEVCADSGHPVSDICPAGRRTSVTAPVCETQPPVCPYHRIVHLSADGAYRVDSGCCKASEIRNEVWFVLPPHQQWYYRKSHAGYRELPPFHPEYSGEGGSEAIQIIYPQWNMKVSTPLALDGKSRGVVFSAAHSNPEATLYWHLDSDYLGSTTGTHKLNAVPESGIHFLTVTDSNGNSASVRFECR